MFKIEAVSRTSLGEIFDSKRKILSDFSNLMVAMVSLVRSRDSNFVDPSVTILTRIEEIFYQSHMIQS